MRILLIDNHALFREGLRYVLQHLFGGVDEILEAGSFTDGLKLAGQHSGLDLALLELKAPGSEGAISVKRFRQHCPHIPLVVVSSEEDSRVITKALAYGASGFVCKSSSGSVLLGALRLALSGSIYVPAQILRQPGVMPVNKTACPLSANEYGLTSRQMHVLEYLVAGLSNKEIANATNIAEGTVKVHLASVYQTLRVKNRVEAVRVAGQLGLSGSGE
jgi:DNA-binding NarL/FixJ family response regulator